MRNYGAQQAKQWSTRSSRVGPSPIFNDITDQPQFGIFPPESVTTETAPCAAARATQVGKDVELRNKDRSRETAESRIAPSLSLLPLASDSSDVGSFPSRGESKPSTETAAFQ